MGHFLPFLLPDNLENQNFQIEKNAWRYYFTHLHHKWQSYDVWFLRYRARQTEFFVILDSFLPFYLPIDPENQNFIKIKIIPKGIIILHKHAINDNHTMYGSWDIKCDGHNFLSFDTVFCSFVPLTTQKLKILKKWKKPTPGDIIILQWCTINDNHMMYGSWDMEHDGQDFLSFWIHFKIKILKNWKYTWRHYHFTQ